MATEPDWSDTELLAVVRAYLAMLADERSGTPYTKSRVIADLHANDLSTRSPKAIEWRMQNISAVLQELGRSWINGYKPASNVGPTNTRRIRDLVSQLDGEAAPTQSRVSDILTLDQLMGVKPVWGAITSRVLCFGGRGTIGAGDRKYYALPSAAAKKAVNRPYVIAIGGGAEVREGFDGRVLNLVRVGTVYGTTELIVGEEEARRLSQWPVAVAVHDVWSFNGYPRLVEDLGLPDRTILSGAQDGITRREPHIQMLWEAVKNWPVTLEPLPPLNNFYDSGRPRLAQTILPMPPGRDRGEEGQRIYREQRLIESDPALKKEAKRLNAARYGKLTCEACQFAHDDSAMFDAHHPTPLSVGVRTTVAAELQVLCPTCHRRAHRKSLVNPFTLDELRAWVAAGRP